jgi:sec-independent protein translocase protein TatC
MLEPTHKAHASFWEHVGVLRNYILMGGGLFIAIAILCFSYFDDTLITLLLAPLHGQSLLFLSPMGPFLFKIKIALYTALLVAFPFWLGLMLRFVSPALPKAKSWALTLFALFSLLLGAASLAITYFYFVPTTLKVLQSFAVAGTTSMLTADSYFNFCILMLAVVFVILQIPVVMAALSYIRLLNPHTLGRYRKFSTLGILVVLAVVTPTTDVMTLIIVTVPALLLWELGIVVSKGLYKK